MSIYGEFDFGKWVQGLMQGREKLLWTGRPDRRTGLSILTHIFVPSSYLFLYFMPAILISTFTALHALPIRVHIFLILSSFLVCFVFVAVWVAYSVLRANTYYDALTNKRAIVLQRAPGESYTSYTFISDEVRKLVRANGNIHIVFDNDRTRNFFNRLYQSTYFDFFAPAGCGIVFRRLSEAGANQVLSQIEAIRRELHLGTGSSGD